MKELMEAEEKRLAEEAKMNKLPPTSKSLTDNEISESFDRLLESLKEGKRQR